MCETAEGVMALETIMEALGQAAPSQESVPSLQVSEDQLRSMMNDDRYHNPAKRDPNFVRQVEEGFKKIYGG